LATACLQADQIGSLGYEKTKQATVAKISQSDPFGIERNEYAVSRNRAKGNQVCSYTGGGDGTPDVIGIEFSFVSFHFFKKKKRKR